MKIATSSSPGGYVSIDLLLTFPRLLQLIHNNSDIIDAVKSSRYLMLSDDKKMIRRRYPYQIPAPSLPNPFLSRLFSGSQCSNRPFIEALVNEKCLTAKKILQK